MENMKQDYGTQVGSGDTHRVTSRRSNQMDHSLPQDAGVSTDCQGIRASSAKEERSDTGEPCADNECVRTAAWRAGRQWSSPGSSRV